MTVTRLCETLFSARCPNPYRLTWHNLKQCVQRPDACPDTCTSWRPTCAHKATTRAWAGMLRLSSEDSPLCPESHRCRTRVSMKGSARCCCPTGALNCPLQSSCKSLQTNHSTHTGRYAWGGGPTMGRPPNQVPGKPPPGTLAAAASPPSLLATATDAASELSEPGAL